MTILWQSFLDPYEHEAYVELLEEVLCELGGGMVDFELVGIRPPDRHLHPLTELRCGLAALRNALYAEQNGYDAVVIGHFQEPCLFEITSTVGIPVVGLGEAALRHACTIGQRIGLVTIDDVFVPWHEDQVRRQGIADRVVGIRSLETAPGDFMAAMRPGPDRTRLLARLEEAVAPLLERGADVLVPAGALPAVALCAQGKLEIGGAQVIDVVAAAARQAISVAGRPALGTNHDRVPAAAVEEFLAATGGPLTPPLGRS